ncbi:solute carrier family 2, facilitated glucose transporter member 1-like isoform X2 [Macrosteles quadrilineatus]|uniref:solute carrier family 2, facilitated glucose transporter member 1-like isoform X2 n=1 Tax=Macrosteles quadrilineatus TaxID=74068 RepID=UPI0023E19116|nr:solute carrier family 2, facilitated glucose transporter member 1-like isoform X2 [Macrosteles quadrilineatus]XP_054271347.1 solute carrier family 2, facilitated glucose transporter member 1-like isoform X2 [Macrosteles quadrilineatus]
MDESSSRTPQKQGLNGRLVFAVAAAALGSSFQHGYGTGVVNAPQKLIEDFIRNVLANRTSEPVSNINQSTVTLIWASAVSIFCVGGMIGGSMVGFVANTFGRKGGLLLNNILVFASALLQGFSKYANSYEMIIAGRFLIGINSGLNAGLAPMYLSEIAPVHLRGAVGTTYQLVLTISILISQILGLSSMLGTEDLWPYLLAVIVLPAIFMVATLPVCPESPKYILTGKGQELEAQRALAWLRGTIEVQDEMDEMRAENEQMKLVPKVTMREMIVNPTLRIPLTIAMVIMIAQQFSGINAAMFFSTSIFKEAKLSDTNAQLATLLMGTVNVLMTLVSLVLVEKAGRKTLLLIGFGGMFIDTILLTIGLVTVDQYTWVSYFCILFVLIFVIMFAVGPGSIPWFLVTELFNQSARPTAASIAVTTNWTANFFVGLGFLPLQVLMGGYVFLIFVVLQGLFTFFVWKKVPETKNKTIEEISSMFRQISYQ